MFEWEILCPLIGLFPVISQTRAIVLKIIRLLFKNGVQRTVFFLNKTKVFFKKPLGYSFSDTRRVINVPGFQYSKVPEFQGSRVPRFQSSKVSEFQGSRVLRFQSSKVPEFQGSRVPRFQSSKVPEFQGSRVPRFQIVTADRRLPTADRRPPTANPEIAEISKKFLCYFEDPRKTTKSKICCFSGPPTTSNPV